MPDTDEVEALARQIYEERYQASIYVALPDAQICLDGRHARAWERCKPEAMVRLERKVTYLQQPTGKRLITLPSPEEDRRREERYALNRSGFAGGSNS